MKLFDDIKNDSIIEQIKKNRQKKNEFNKKLYDTDIIQGLFDRINMLEKRIDGLEKERLK